MKIKEIVDLKPVTLEGPQIDALKAMFKSGNINNYLKDRRVIAVGNKVSKAFNDHMKGVAKQAQQTFGLSQKELDAQPGESLEKLGDIMQLTEEEEQQLTEEVLQELLPALAAIGSGLGAGARAVGSAVGAGAKAVTRGVKRVATAANQALANRAEKQMQAKAAKPPKPGDVDGDGDVDREDNQNFQAYVKDFASNKVFYQNVDRIENQKIKSAVDDTIKSMRPDDVNQAQWIKLVALSQQMSALDPTNMSRAQQATANQTVKLLKTMKDKKLLNLTPAGEAWLDQQGG